MTNPPLIPAPTLRGCQIYKTELPHQKMVRFVTALGDVSVMADKKALLEIGRGMIAAAETMPDRSDLS
jgi:hypothetical protein